MSINDIAVAQMAALHALGITILNDNQHLERAVMDGFDGEPPSVSNRICVAPSGAKEKEAVAKEELSQLEENSSAFGFLVTANPEDVAKRQEVLKEFLETNFDKLGKVLAEKHPEYKPSAPTTQTEFANASGPENNFLSDFNKGPSFT